MPWGICAVYYSPNKAVQVCTKSYSVCHVKASFGKHSINQAVDKLKCYSKAITVRALLRLCHWQSHRTQVEFVNKSVPQYKKTVKEGLVPLAKGSKQTHHASRLAEEKTEIALP